jgi:hypothetical protein
VGVVVHMCSWQCVVDYVVGSHVVVVCVDGRGTVGDVSVTVSVTIVWAEVPLDKLLLGASFGSATIRFGGGLLGCCGSPFCGVLQN